MGFVEHVEVACGLLPFFRHFAPPAAPSSSPGMNASVAMPQSARRRSVPTYLPLCLNSVAPEYHTHLPPGPPIAPWRLCCALALALTACVLVTPSASTSALWSWSTSVPPRINSATAPPHIRPFTHKQGPAAMPRIRPSAAYPGPRAAAWAADAVPDVTPASETLPGLGWGMQGLLALALGIVTFKLPSIRRGLALQAALQGAGGGALCECEPGPPPDAAPGDFYLEGCAQCMRAWNKSAKNARPEPWRGEQYSTMDCGEDSFMLSSRVLAVADGVGGWRKQGIDPSLFANSLMQEVKVEVEAVEAAGGYLDPVVLMEEAYARACRAVKFGSATCCVACLAPDGTLNVANLGDSALLVIRGTSCILFTDRQQVKFNAPYQLSTHPRLPELMCPANSVQETLQTRPGDILVVASDGLLDNLFERDIVGLVVQAQAKGWGQPMIARLLKQVALNNTRDMTYESPFAVGAREAGYRYVGGKPDDITVLVAKVVQA